jgi:uncharacterized delta-60 repeat protein
MLLQPDGKILLAGNFLSFSGKSSKGIVRLNQDGNIDNSFNIGLGFNLYDGTLNTDENSVYNIELQKDGKIIAVGRFGSFNGKTSNGIVRINSNGSIDETFNTGSGFGFSIVRSVKVQSSGKIIVGGSFQSYNGIQSKFFIRLNNDGTPDNCL